MTNELLSPRADPPRGARVRAGRRATVPDPEGGAGPVGEGARPVVGRARRRGRAGPGKRSKAPKSA